MTINETPLLLEETQSRMRNILNDLEKLSQNLNGSQMDIDSGTLIKIHTDAGYVSCSKAADNLSLTVSCYFKNVWQQELVNVNDEKT